MASSQQEKLVLFERASQDYPLARLFVENLTLRQSGLNLADYVHVQRLPMACCFPDVEHYLDADVGEHLGHVTLGQETITRVGGLWDRFRAARKELVEVFSGARFRNGIKLEDVLLIQALFRQGLLSGNLHIVSKQQDSPLRSSPLTVLFRRDRSSQGLVDLLHDLSVFCTALPGNEKVREFTQSLAPGSTARTLSEAWAFLRGLEGDMGREFARRIVEFYEPEYRVRFWEQLVERHGGWRNESAHDWETLCAVGFSEGVRAVVADNPSAALHALQDGLKNSLGNSVLAVCQRCRSFLAGA